MCYLISAGKLAVYVLIFIKQKRKEGGRRENTNILLESVVR